MQTQTLPAHIPDQFASVSGLGTLQTIYPVAASNRWISAIGGVILVGAGGLAVVYGLYDTSVQVAKYGPVMFGKTIVAPLIIAAFLLLFGLLAVFNAYQSWNKSAAIYEKGLAYCDNSGVQTWTWPDVEWLYCAITKHYTNGIYTGTTYVYTLHKADGSKIRLDNKFKNIETLGRTINQKAAPIQYERLLQQLRNGQSVKLGEVTISKENLTISKKTFAWNEIASVGINKGFVNIKKKDGGWFSGGTAAVANIPNLDALLAVIDQIVKVKAG